MDKNERTVSLGQVFTYGAGGMFTYGFQLVLTGYFLNFFMTDVLMIPTTLAAFFNVLAQFLKVGTMAIAGVIMDAVVLKQGKYRTWYLICGILLGVSLPLTFLNMGIDPTVGGIVFLVFYTIMMTSYNIGWTALRTLAGKLGKTTNDAVLFGSASNVAGTIPSIIYPYIGPVLLAIPMPFFKSANNPYFMFGVVSGILIIIGGFVIFNLAKDVDGPQTVTAAAEGKVEKAPKAPKLTIVDMVKNLRGPGLVYMLAYFVSCMQSGTFSVLLPYYCNYVLNNPGITAATISANAAAACVGSFFVPAIAKKFGKKSCFIWYHIAQAALYGVLVLIGNNGTMFVVIRAIQTGVGCFGICLLPSFMADIADYNEMHGQKGAHAFLQSMGGLVSRLGNSISATVAAFGLSIIGYSVGCEITTKIANGFTALLIVLPGVCCALAAVIMFFYKIDEIQLNEYRLNK